jgi:hypothetical protein
MSGAALLAQSGQHRDLAAKIREPWVSHRARSFMYVVAPLTVLREQHSMSTMSERT